jgi:predicted nucleotidyltransferase
VRSKRQSIIDFLEERGITDVRIFGSIARGDADGEVLELSELLSAIVGARVDVVSARSLRPEIRQRAMRGDTTLSRRDEDEELDRLEATTAERLLRA